MKVLVILAHPEGYSFNHAVYDKVIETLEAEGHDIITHDLYAEGFIPVLPGEEISRKAILPDNIQAHCRELVETEGIIIVHPNWWGQPPAILKGWVDRVIRPGIAYEFIETGSGDGAPRGLLNTKFALILNTSNTSTEREEGVFGDPLETLWKNCIFGLCGVDNFHRRMFNVIVTSSDSQRLLWLAETEKIVTELTGTL